MASRAPGSPSLNLFWFYLNFGDFWTLFSVLWTAIRVWVGVWQPYFSLKLEFSTSQSHFGAGKGQLCSKNKVSHYQPKLEMLFRKNKNRPKMSIKNRSKIRRCKIVIFQIKIEISRLFPDFIGIFTDFSRFVRLFSRFVHYFYDFLDYFPDFPVLVGVFHFSVLATAPLRGAVAGPGGTP